MSRALRGDLLRTHLLMELARELFARPLAERLLDKAACSTALRAGEAFCFDTRCAIGCDDDFDCLAVQEAPPI